MRRLEEGKVVGVYVYIQVAWLWVQCLLGKGFVQTNQNVCVGREQLWYAQKKKATEQNK